MRQLGICSCLLMLHGDGCGPVSAQQLCCSTACKPRTHMLQNAWSQQRRMYWCTATACRIILSRGQAPTCTVTATTVVTAEHLAALPLPHSATHLACNTLSTFTHAVLAQQVHRVSCAAGV
jgi:hypothetical protein